MKPHLHFMGIGGIGMSGLASWYRADGYPVSGCDAASSPHLDTLRAAGIVVDVGHHPGHVEGVDVLVSSMAVPNTRVANSFEEILAADEQGIKAIKRIDLLANLFAKRQAIGITGTHGKSTTTGMAACLFLELCDDPSVQIGAVLPELGSNMRYGLGPHLIAEVDESDPGFANLEASLAVITNLEDDHIAGGFSERRNYHATLADLQRATRAYAAASDQVLYCADWPGLNEVLEGVPNCWSYGTAHEATFRIEAISLEGTRSRFRLVLPGGESLAVRLAIPGEHNIRNAAAAIAATYLNGLEPGGGLEALAHFTGVGRRWEYWGTVNDALIIDDYAHHPTEVAATLTAAKGTGRRVRAVLQPHRWVRTAQHWPALADAAAMADEILVLDIYGAGEDAIPGISPSLIIDRLVASGKSASRHDHRSAEAYLAQSLAAGDLIITLGAGDVWRVAASLAGKGGHVAG